MLSEYTLFVPPERLLYLSDLKCSIDVIYVTRRLLIHFSTVIRPSYNSLFQDTLIRLYTNSPCRTKTYKKIYNQRTPTAQQLNSQRL